MTRSLLLIITYPARHWLALSPAAAERPAAITYCSVRRAHPEAA
jgi:hypothetical protein